VDEAEIFHRSPEWLHIGWSIRALLLRQLRETALEQPALGLLPRQLDGAPVRHSRFLRLAELTVEFRPRRMRGAIVRELTAVEDGVDDRDAGRGTIARRDRHGAIQLDDGRRRQPEEDVV